MQRGGHAPPTALPAGIELIALTKQHAAGFWPLVIAFALFMLFMYGRMAVIFVLSFQGPEGDLTFPLHGV